MDEELYQDLMDDNYRDDPVGHETKWGEGWTRETWIEYFLLYGYDAGVRNDRD